MEKSISEIDLYDAAAEAYSDIEKARQVLRQTNEKYFSILPAPGKDDVRRIVRALSMNELSSKRDMDILSLIDRYQEMVIALDIVEDYVLEAAHGLREALDNPHDESEGEAL